MTIRMGAHVDQHDPITAARELGAGCVQFFLGNPLGWKGPEVAYEGGAEALKAAGIEADVEFFIHAPYVLNVATTNNRVRIPSRKLLQQQVKAAAEIGAKGVIVHGGHVGKDDNAEVGFDNWRKCVEGLELPIPILIENTAGGANAMARHLERIERLWDAISMSGNINQVGFCLDTCHGHAGGNELVGLVDKIKAITGRVDLVHCNDSRDAFNSGADRHANLGDGFADPDGIIAVIRDANAPVILETPGSTPEHRADLEWLSERLGDPE